MNAETIGIIAGRGQFPFMVAARARESGLGVAAIGFSGHTDAGLEQAVDAYKSLHLGQLAKMISFFTSRGVSRVVLAGAINKPRALDIRPDFRAVKLICRLGAKGDDVILRAVAAELESEGMTIVSPLELVPSLSTPSGILTRRKPTPEQMEDLRRAWPLAMEVGRLDIGQGLAMRSGVVLAVEAIEGTDAMIRRAGEHARGNFSVLKICKPGQDLRIDLPAAGLDTVRTMTECGCGCLGLQAGQSVFFDLEEAVALADKKKIALVGVTPSILGLGENGT